MHWTPSKQKLIADLSLRQNIVVHYVLLRWILANSFNFRKMHRALQFDQNRYMKTFIDTFVSKRSEAKTKVEKEIFQLILNSAIGKMFESVRNRSCCDVVTDPKECARIIADENFTSFTIIGSNVVLLHRKNEV